MQKAGLQDVRKSVRMSAEEKRRNPWNAALSIILNQ